MKLNREALKSSINHMINIIDQRFKITGKRPGRDFGDIGDLKLTIHGIKYKNKLMYTDFHMYSNSIFMELYDEDCIYDVETGVIEHIPHASLTITFKRSINCERIIGCDCTNMITDIVSSFVALEHDRVGEILESNKYKCDILSYYFGTLSEFGKNGITWRDDRGGKCIADKEENFVCAKTMLSNILNFPMARTRIGYAKYAGLRPVIRRINKVIDDNRYYRYEHIAVDGPELRDQDIKMNALPEFFANLFSKRGRYPYANDRLIALSINMDDYEEPNTSVILAKPPLHLTAEDWCKIMEIYDQNLVVDPNAFIIMNNRARYERIACKPDVNCIALLYDLMRQGVIPLFWLSVGNSGHDIGYLYMARNEDVMKKLFNK